MLPLNTIIVMPPVSSHSLTKSSIYHDRSNGSSGPKDIIIERNLLHMNADLFSVRHFSIKLSVLIVLKYEILKTWMLQPWLHI